MCTDSETVALSCEAWPTGHFIHKVSLDAQSHGKPFLLSELTLPIKYILNVSIQETLAECGSQAGLDAKDVERVVIGT